MGALCRLLSAVHAEFPGGVELRTAAGAVLRGEILAAVRAVGHCAPFGQSTTAEPAPFERIQGRDAGDGEGRGALTVSASDASSADRVASRVLGGNGNSDFLH